MNSSLRTIEGKLQNAERASVRTDSLDASYMGLAQLTVEFCQAALSSIVVIGDARIWCREATPRQFYGAPAYDPFFDLTSRTRDLIEINEPEFDPNCRCFLIDVNQTKVRSYAGCAVRSDTGNLVGTLGAYYVSPQKITWSQKSSLVLLAKQLAGQVHLRAQLADLVLQSGVSQLPAAMSEPRAAIHASEKFAFAGAVEASPKPGDGESSAERKDSDSRTVSIVRAGRHFTGHYTDAEGAITVTHGLKTRTTRLGGTPAQVVARQLLYDMVGSSPLRMG